MKIRQRDYQSTIRHPKRREFLLGAGLAATTVFASARAGGLTVPDRGAEAEPVYDVVVIGAGLAGLTAARELHEAGRRVVLLEASTRVGGRTWSVPFDDTGLTVDLGAEWVTPAWHTATASELERYRIPLDWEEEPDEGVVSAPEYSDAFVAVMANLDRDASLVRFDEPDWYRDAERLDITMENYVSGLNLDTATREQLLAYAFSLMGAHHREYSALNLLHEIAGYGSSANAFGADSARIEGGADALAKAMAAELDDVLRLGWPVARIEMTAPGVLVSGERGRIRADAGVIALPVNVLSDLDLRIPLSSEASRVIQEGHAGRAAKGWAAVSPGKDVYSVGWPDAIEAYTLQGDDAAVLASFGIGLPETQSALARAWASVRERHPELQFNDRYLNHDWIAFPYSKGTWASPRPLQQRGWHDLADNPPPFVFAGGDISRRWFGWMEGAVTSGKDAASRLMRYLEGKPVPPATG